MLGDLMDLIFILPELIDLFLPGFICICIYSKLYNKQFDISVMFLWSIFTTYLIKAFYVVAHSWFLTGYDFNESLKIIIYTITGAIIPCMFSFIYKSTWFKAFMLKLNYQTINSDIFDDIIDYENKTIMSVYLKGSNNYYIGTFSLKEENGKDSYIALIDYMLMDSETDEKIFEPEDPSSVVINLNDVERIELTYSTGSSVWENLKK